MLPANRIKKWSWPPVEVSPQPSPSATFPVQVPLGFAVCPPQLAIPQGWQQAIYQLAYERALAQTQIPRHHRSLFCVWN